MAAQTTSQNLTELANQMFAGAREAADEATREQMLKMAAKLEADAAELRVAEAAKDRADREFWASQDVVTNWVS
jgi:hypothetical protein